MRLAIAAFCLVIPPTAAAQEAGNRLNLVCLGAGSANKQSNNYAYLQGSNGNSAWGNIVGNRSVPFEDQVNIWIEGDEGRIRLPRTMLPLLRGGDDGWFKIKSLVMSATEISGSVAVNFVNNPKLRLDRITGGISMSGKAGDYSGKCAKYDPEKAERAF